MSRIHSKWLVVISVLFGTFTVILNNSMLNPTLPYFMETFDVDAVAVSWLLTIFMVSMGMTMPVTGYLGDRFGKKKIYMKIGRASCREREEIVEVGGRREKRRVTMV